MQIASLELAESTMAKRALVAAIIGAGSGSDAAFARKFLSGGGITDIPAMFPVQRSWHLPTRNKVHGHSN
jgi:hypothetical protein